MNVLGSRTEERSAPLVSNCFNAPSQYARQDLNLQPAVDKTVALTVELRALPNRWFDAEKTRSFERMLPWTAGVQL